MPADTYADFRLRRLRVRNTKDAETLVLELEKQTSGNPNVGKRTEALAELHWRRIVPKGTGKEQRAGHLNQGKRDE